MHPAGCNSMYTAQYASLFFSSWEEGSCLTPRQPRSSQRDCEWVHTCSPVLHLQAGLSLGCILFSQLQNPPKNPLVSLFKLEFKLVDSKIKDLTFIIAFHSHPKCTPSSKLKVHICTVSKCLCLLVDWWRGGHRTHIMSLLKAAEWEFELSLPAKGRWMELVSKQQAYF